MNMNIKAYLTRLKNPGTLITLVSLIVLLLTINGVKVDDARIMNSVKIICSVLAILGIMNNPDTPGLDLPTTKSSEVVKQDTTMNQ